MNSQVNSRRRAEVNGRFVQFFRCNTKIAMVRWYSRFKAEYRTKADAKAAKQVWEEKGRILQRGEHPDIYSGPHFD